MYTSEYDAQYTHDLFVQDLTFACLGYNDIRDVNMFYTQDDRIVGSLPLEDRQLGVSDFSDSENLGQRTCSFKVEATVGPFVPPVPEGAGELEETSFPLDTEP